MTAMNSRSQSRLAISLFIISASLHASFGAAQCLDPATGLIGWWPAEGTMTDVIGGNHGTAGFPVAYSAGKVGQAFDLDGSGVIDVPYASVLSPQSITIEAWFYAHAIDGFRRIVNQASYDLFIGPNGLIRCIIDTDAIMGLEISAGATVLSPSTWYHLACTWDAATAVGRVYVDGVPVGSGVDLTDNDPLVVAPGSVLLGGWSGQNIDGLLDEVSIYNRALSSAEISTIFAAGPDGKCIPIFADTFESGTTTAWSSSVP